MVPGGTRRRIMAGGQEMEEKRVSAGGFSNCNKVNNDQRRLQKKKTRLPGERGRKQSEQDSGTLVSPSSY